ncbi:RHS repeat-associated core domain-containing protein [Candidatus Gracilibacteria bacterium]|nr:RHS repeat-associated core domain-containing protein [Candidatus Gracilibacteria bacterium]
MSNFSNYDYCYIRYTWLTLILYTLGRRIEKIDYSKSATNPESTVYIYNGDNIQSEYMTTSILVNGTGTLTPITLKKNYLNSIGTDSVLAYDAEQQVNPTSTGKITTRYYYHTNQLGSVIAISTSTGLVVQKYTYNAYGKPYIYSGSTLTPLSSYTGTLYGNTRLYTGREYDRETGYYYLRARTYSPDLGRFLSRDPIGQNDQVNLYTYVANSPLKYTDRFGREKALILIGKESRRFGIFDSTVLEKAKIHEIARLKGLGIKEKNIDYIYMEDIDDFKEGIQSTKYRHVTYILHGSESAMKIDKNKNIRVDSTNIGEITPLPASINREIGIISCNVGNGDNSIAQQLSTQIHEPVIAPDGFVTVNENELFVSSLGYSFLHEIVGDTFGLTPGSFNKFNP